MHYRISSYVAKAEPYLGFDFFPCHELYCCVRNGEKNVWIWSSKESTFIIKFLSSTSLADTTK